MSMTNKNTSNCNIVLFFLIFQVTQICSQDLTKYVNPFVGTSKMGHVFPGATVPFGMVQLSPQTNFEVMHQEDGSYNKKTYEYCAGYQYRDTTIIGFSHTNFSGTGHSDLGDLLVMPTIGELVLEPLKRDSGEKGFYSLFSHDQEEASPGYYKVKLKSYDITAEHTTTERVGFHQYTFPKVKRCPYYSRPGLQRISSRQQECLDLYSCRE